MALNDVLSEFATRLGLKDTEIETLRQKQRRLSDAIRANLDRLDALKEKVDDIDVQLMQKKKEYDAAAPSRKRIVKVELSHLFRKQDLALEGLPLISQHLQRDEMTKDKLDMLIFASEHPALPDDEIDEIILSTREFLDNEKRREKASNELENASYASMENSEELDERISLLTTEPPTENLETGDPLDERIAQMG